MSKFCVLWSKSARQLNYPLITNSDYIIGIYDSIAKAEKRAKEIDEHAIIKRHIIVTEGNYYGSITNFKLEIDDLPEYTLYISTFAFILQNDKNKRLNHITDPFLKHYYYNNVNIDKTISFCQVKSSNNNITTIYIDKHRTSIIQVIEKMFKSNHTCKKCSSGCYKNICSTEFCNKITDKLPTTLMNDDKNITTIFKYFILNTT